jgi:hypothetical protein
MNQNRKSKLIILAVILTAFGLFIVYFRSAGVGMGQDTPNNIYISAEENETKSALIGTYDWSFRNKHFHAAAGHPKDFDYGPGNIVSVTGEQQLIISTQRLRSDKQSDFTVESLSVYKDGQATKFGSVEQSIVNGDLYLLAPSITGEYIYELILNIKNKGIVTYGFVVRVDLLIYDLAEISKYKTHYVGDNSKVLAIASRLPVPDNYFRQQYIFMETGLKPYRLTIYYEAESDAEYTAEWPIVTPDSAIETNSRTNALVVFSMIDNLSEVTFAFRISQSDGILDPIKYDTSFTFQRASFEDLYGNLSALSENLPKLQRILADTENALKKDPAVELSLPELTDAEVNEARAVVVEYYRAVAEKNAEAILATLYPREQLTIESVKNGSIKLYGTETCTLISIDYDPQDEKRASYRPSNHHISAENIVVFKTSFNIDYPLKDGGPWNEGIYNNWSMILIRDDENSPWFIYDQGY